MTDVRKASTAIANAWLSCVTEAKQVAYHYITPSRDPTRFSYTIGFAPGSDITATKLERLEAYGDGIACPGLPKTGSTVKPGGTTTICHRNADAVVTIAASTTHGNKLKVIELPAYEPGPKVTWTQPTGVTSLTSKCILSRLEN